MFRQYKLRNYSFPLIAAVIALSMIGIMVIGSAQQSSQTRQIFGLVIGSPVALLVQNTDCFAIATPGNWVACAVCCVLGFLVAYLLSRLDKSETVQ